MPVFNKMVLNGTEYILGGGGNIGEPLNLTVTSAGLDATITWEDNEIGTIPPTTFQKSELVRKIGSAPTSPSDGDLVVTETVKDTYKTTGYVDQGLTDGETYYYRVFSYSDLGGISYCDAVNVTASGGWQPTANTLYYYNIDDNDTTSTLYDKTGNYDMTWTGTPSFTNESGLGRVIVLDGTVYSTASSYVNYGDEYTFVCVVNGDGDFYCQGASLSRVADKGLYWDSNSITFRTGNDTGYDTLDCNSNPGYGKWSIYAFVGSRTGNYRKVYVDGTLVDSNTYYNSSQGGGDYGHIGIWRSGGAITQIFNGKMKSFLAENVAWTEQEIQDYCDMIQANYGIS